MANEPAAVDSPTIVNTPAPVPPVAPESKMFPTTPTTNEPTAPTSGTPPAAPVVTPPVAPVEPVVPPQVPPTEPKPPTEPIKAEAPKAPPTPPTEYDLKLPEGSPLSEADRAEALKEAKEAGLTKEEADAMILSKDQLARTVVARQQEAFKTQQDQALEAAKTQWKDETSKDKELGGERYQESVLKSSRIFNEAASPLLKKLANETGFGNHPEFVRFLVNLYDKFGGEDRFVRGQVGPAPASTDNSIEARAARLYGKTTPDASGKLVTSEA